MSEKRVGIRKAWTYVGYNLYPYMKIEEKNC
jgi:hypothetical protein